MILLEPAWLGLFVLLPLLFLRRHLRRAALLRAFTFALIILALAHPVRLVDDERDTRILIVDTSASLDEAHSAAATDLARELQTRFQKAGPFERFNTPASDLGAALARAAAAIPIGRPGSITLITDGAATDATWKRAARNLGARELPVHAIRAGSPDDPRLTGLRPVIQGAGRPRVGAPLVLEVEVQDAPAAFGLTLSSGATQIAAATFAPEPDQRGRFLARIGFEPDASQAGFAHVTASFTKPPTAATDRPENNRLEATLPIEAATRVACLGERMQAGRDELAHLLGAGFALEARTPADLEGSAGADLLAGYAAVVLDDIPAATLGDAAAANIAKAVQDGGLGLFASGGAAAFGPGGWHDTPIETLLPVELVQKEEKRDPSTTLVVIIDTSGSMGGNRVQLAKEVSRLAIRRLLPHDKVGIVEFFGAKRWAAPIQPASNAIELERALNRLSAGGGTVILPAIEEAYYGLKNVHTRYKHVLILTDGGVETGAFEPLLRAMSEDGVNVSTVLIGSDAHSEFLVTLANWGKGRFYSVPNRFNLPEILLKQPTTAKLPAWRPGPHALVTRGGPKWWGPLQEDGPLPDLDAYTETRLRPGATSLIETAAEGHPVLATWDFGLGHVTAFTTEPAGEGTANWREDELYGPLLARVLERTARTEDSLELRAVRDGLDVGLTLESCTPDASSTEASLQVNGQPQPAFTKQAPRRTEAQLFDASAAPLELELTTQRGKQLAVAAPAHTAELAVPAANLVDLELLARATLGSVTDLDQLTSPEARRAFDAPTGSGQDARRESALWPLFLLAALLAYLAEVLIRRLDTKTPTPRTS